MSISPWIDFVASLYKSEAIYLLFNRLACQTSLWEKCTSIVKQKLPIWAYDAYTRRNWKYCYGRYSRHNTEYDYDECIVEQNITVTSILINDV